MKTKFQVLFCFVMCLFLMGTVVETTLSDESECCCSTGEVNDCLVKELEKADTILNQIYHKLLSQRKKEDQEFNKAGLPGGAASHSADALISAQKAWIKYRDANCNFYYALSYSGTGAPIEYGFCMVKMTKERTVELKKTVEGDQS